MDTGTEVRLREVVGASNCDSRGWVKAGVSRDGAVAGVSVPPHANTAATITTAASSVAFSFIMPLFVQNNAT